MRRAPPIELSSEEFAALQRTVRSSRSSVREVFRARIVLLAAEGLENLDIAEQLGTGPDTVSKWRRRFVQQRLAGLIDRPGRGRKPHYARELIERIVDDTVHRTPEQATHWSTRTMAKHAGVSHTVSGHSEPWLRDPAQCGGGSWWCGPRSERRGSSANSDFHIRGVSSMARLAGCTLMRWSTSTR